MIGDYEKSISYLERAVELDNNNPDYKTTLAVQHKISGNYKYAAKLFREGGSNRWRENELNCLYLAKDNLDDFYSKLDSYSLEDDSSPLISSIHSHAETVLVGLIIMNFVKKSGSIYKKIFQNYLKRKLFNRRFIVDTKLWEQIVFLNCFFNGEQSAGNIFSLPLILLKFYWK